jgi:hypothetical protein
VEMDLAQGAVVASLEVENMFELPELIGCLEEEKDQSSLWDLRRERLGGMCRRICRRS